MEKINNVNFKKFEDKYGNLLNEYEIIVYYKDSDGKWNEEKRFNSGRGWYVIEGILYYRMNKNLSSVNMDFDSKTCGACYKIGNKITNDYKIIGRDVLFTCKKENSSEKMYLEKELYSDGTCFYSLKDKANNSNSSSDLNDIINSIKNHLKYIVKLKGIDVSVYNSSNNFYNNILFELEKVKAITC